MLAQRADYLLRMGQCRYPRRILAISFKVDAAKNLVDRVRRRCPPDLAARLDSYTFHAFAKRLIDTFRPVLTGGYALDQDYEVGPSFVPPHQIDFQSMVALGSSILEASPVARSALRQTYQFVFLDEFQDCTANQYALMRSAFHGTGVRLIAVGDVKQRIMGWAGALQGVLATFEEDFSAERLILYANFRSKPRLRRMQNEMVRVMAPEDALDDADIPGDGGTVEVLRYNDSAEEARDLATRIHTWITADEVPAEEIAVLLSKQLKLYTETLMTELRARGVPFRDVGELQDLAAEPVASLIIDFLTVVTDDKQPDADDRLMERAAGRRSDEEDAERSFSRLRVFVDEARVNYRSTPEVSLRGWVERLLSHLGEDLLTSLAPNYHQGTRLQDVIAEVLTKLSEIYQRTSDTRQTLCEFTGRSAVKLMTIHKAKGMEFDSVIVLGVENEMFWDALAQERAAYFVAISRAKRHLCLTFAATRPRPAGAGRWNINRTPHGEFIGYAELR